MPQSTAITTFLHGCTSCGACQLACPFLEKYGTPDSIISARTEDVFLCTNCQACDRLCPSELSPSDAMHALKQELIETNRMSEKTQKLLNSSYAFAKRGHYFPFSYYSSCEIAFWPGCSLMGTRPDIVKKIPKLLKERYGKVELVFDCCFDPLFHNGATDTVKAAAERINDRLKRHNIKKLILGCTNCKKIFSLFMPEIDTIHIITALTDSTITKSINHQLHTEVFLHHPCPAFRFDEVREKAASLISRFAKVKNQLPGPSCCGLGGGSHTLSEDLSDKFAERVIKSAKDTLIVTYCMGCKNKFLKNNGAAYHLFEIVTGLEPINKPVSAGKKWLNRLILAIEQRLKNKKFILGVLVVLTISFATYLRKSGYISPEYLFEFIKEHKVIAPLLFILIYAIGPSVFLPSLPLTLGAGFLWGPFWGVVFSISGATIGASIPFLLSRYIIGDAIIKRFSYTKWNWLKEKVEHHGWKAVAFTRIVPIFPYPVLNYLFGITPVPFLHYLWSTFVFMLPACIAYTAFGSSMGELILKGNIKGLIIGILIATLALLLPFALKPILKKIISIKDEK